MADLVVAAGRRLSRVLPPGLRRRLDDRVFYAVFNLTRVTNDNYGWRPGPPGPAARAEEDPEE